jgi:hypothetical protein
VIFSGRIEQTARENGSNLVLAFDFPFEGVEKRKMLFTKAEDNNGLTLVRRLVDSLQR